MPPPRGVPEVHREPGLANGSPHSLAQDGRDPLLGLAGTTPLPGIAEVTEAGRASGCPGHQEERDQPKGIPPLRPPGLSPTSLLDDLASRAGKFPLLLQPDGGGPLSLATRDPTKNARGT